MEELIYSKILEYNPELGDFEISFSDNPLSLSELITLYLGRYKMAKDEYLKKINLKVYDDLVGIKDESVKNLKIVTINKVGISKLFFFSEDYSMIFSDLTFPNNI